VTPGPDSQSTRSQRWLARLSFVLACLATAILVVFILAPIAVIVVYAFRNLLRVASASAAAWLLASVTARQALTGAERTGACPSTPPRPPSSDMRAISRSSELASAQYTSMIQYPVQVDR
jgi:ABC-type sugar transport system permease subunit